MSLAGKVVIITGASAGIGATTAEAFAKLGSKVVIVGRNEANLKATEDACKAANSKAEIFPIAADVTVDGERIINKTIEKFGQLDVLVNNAGVLGLGNILDIEVDQLDMVLNTNLRAVFILTKLAAPHLIKTQGNVVNVSSLVGLRSFANSSTYCISKAALDQFTRCIALDLADKKVRVNSVNPGVIVTDFQKRVGLTVEQVDQMRAHCKKTHALGRPGETGEVAEAITFLASDSASFITGATLPVDGGANIMCAN